MIAQHEERPLCHVHRVTSRLICEYFRENCTYCVKSVLNILDLTSSGRQYDSLPVLDKHLVGGAEDGWLMIYDKNTGFHIGGCQDPKKPSHAAPVSHKFKLVPFVKKF